MVTIIVKKNPSHSMFRSHFNQATGRYHHTKEDYMSTIKTMGLEPYKGEVKREAPKKYVGVSDEAHRMMAGVSYDKTGKPNIGDRYIDALKSMGMKKVPDNLKNKTTGGFDNGK